MQWSKFLSVAIVALGFMSSVSRADVYITVSLSEQEMTVRADGYEGMAIWDVSTGRRGFKTPTGYFQPQWTTRMHRSRKYNNAPMPYSIFFHGGYAIHGTDHVDNLGRPASHGCIRLHPENAELLFSIVKEAGMKNTHINIVP